MRYVIFVIDDTTNSASGNEIAAIDAFNDALRANGHWVIAVGIAAPDRATLIDNRGGKGESAARSLFSGGDHYSGLWIITAPTAEVAHGLAMEGSKACNRRVELRPLLG
ncbi:MAG: YciI family protein [Candidatus Limnocylindrus sp.]|jgi:hypothetical protein